MGFCYQLIKMKVEISKDELRQILADAVSSAIKATQPEIWLSVAEIVKEFKVSRQTVYRLKKEHYITPNTLGRYSKKELEKALLANGN